MKVSGKGGGSSLGKSPRGNHVCEEVSSPYRHAPRRWNPVSFSSWRRFPFPWNPVCIGPLRSQKPSWKITPHWPVSKAFLNRGWGYWPGHLHLFKSWRRPLLGQRGAALRDVLHRGWCRTLYGKTTDHRMLLTQSFHKECFLRYSGYSREMAPIHAWYSSYIAKGSFPWQHGAWGTVGMVSCRGAG